MLIKLGFSEQVSIRKEKKGNDEIFDWMKTFLLPWVLIDHLLRQAGSRKFVMERASTIFKMLKLSPRWARISLDCSVLGNCIYMLVYVQFFVPHGAFSLYKVHWYSMKRHVRGSFGVRMGFVLSNSALLEMEIPWPTSTPTLILAYVVSASKIKHK